MPPATPITSSPSDAVILNAPFRLELVPVPAGEFLMGSDPARDTFAQPDELPQRRVYLSVFTISKYEITNAQYAVFAQAAGLPFEYADGESDYPAVHMSWYEAVAFCDWLSQTSGHSVRLPTEAEWEKAARGTNGRLYPWGNSWDRAALNTCDGGVGRVTAVDAFSPAGDSPYGVSDMVGNVWEWTADWYSPTTYADQHDTSAPVENPTGPAEGTHRVLRGGSHFFRQSGTRAARRFKYIPASRCYDIGFRVVVADW